MQKYEEKLIGILRDISKEMKLIRKELEKANNRCEKEESDIDTEERGMTVIDMTDFIEEIKRGGNDDGSKTDLN